MKQPKTNFIILAILLMNNMVLGQVQKSRVEFPYYKSGNTQVDLLYVSDSTIHAEILITIHKLTPHEDSILVFSKHISNIKLPRKKHLKEIHFKEGADSNGYIDKSFATILQKTGHVPPGNYLICCEIKSENQSSRQFLSLTEDSVLSLDGRHNAKTRKYVSSKFNKYTRHVSGRSANKIAARHLSDRMERSGFIVTESNVNNKIRLNLSYGGWYAGRYEIDENPVFKLPNAPDLPSKAGQKEDNTVFSGFRKTGGIKKQEELTGLIGVTTYLSNGQEEMSGISNNYTEVRGEVEVPVLGIPVDLQGLYTTQDMNREIKSSYFRVHYDAEKVKQSVLSKISSYNSRYSEKKAGMAGTSQIYRSAISKLESQKSTLEHMGSDKEDSPTSADPITRNAKIANLDKKIASYRQLLEQAENANYFDSVMTFSKTSGIENSDLSTKQLLKKGSNLFPHGESSKILAGLNSFDAGMFPKDASKYTMNGQMIKGIDGSYDLGSCQAGATVGKTEYIGRDGTPDKYTCYSGSIKYKPAAGQTMDFIYYGYMADRKYTLSDNFLGSTALAVPGFFDPVHILSVKYSGALSDHIRISGEGAGSVSKTEETLNTGNIAYSVNADGEFAKAPISWEASYEKTGNNFVNNTVPVLMSGTERYRIAGRTDIFKAFATVGGEFNKISQTNTYSTGNNIKWGFDIRTNSKRYPTIALSYKPFTTFRSLSDTLSVPQKPLVGSVWAGNVSYSYKRTTGNWRFSLLYNKAATSFDTSSYSNELLQGMATFASEKYTLSGNIGRTSSSGTTLSSTIPAMTEFISIALSMPLGKYLNISAIQDIATSFWGLSRIAPGGNIIWRWRKVPLTLRCGFKYNTYKVTYGQDWRKLSSGNLDLMYKFHRKLTHNN